MGIYLSEWKISKKKKERLNFHPIPRQIKAILIIDIFQNFKRMISMKLNFSKHSRSASDEGRNLFERKVNSKKRRDDWSKKRERERERVRRQKKNPFRSNSLITPSLNSAPLLIATANFRLCTGQKVLKSL